MQSESINELAMALAKAQGEMEAAIKDALNPFFKSKYADLTSVWAVARNPLSKNGLCVIQTTEEKEGKIILVTTLAHSSGQWVKSFIPLNPAKNDAQGVGASISYYRRYSLSAIIGVVSELDDDGETAVGRGDTKQSKANQEEPKISKDQEKEILKLLELCEQNFLSNFFSLLKKNKGILDIKDVKASEYEQIIGYIKKYLDSKDI